MQTAGPALERKGDIAAFLTALEPRSVFFVDEIHRLAAHAGGDLLPGDGGPPPADHRRPGRRRARRDARAAALHARRRHHPHGPADHAAARPLRHPGAPGALRAAGAGGDRAPLGGDPRDRPRGRGGAARSPPAAAAPRAWPTACSSACATTPRCAWTASSAPRPRTRRWRCSRSTSSAWTASTARSCRRSA